MKKRIIILFLLAVGRCFAQELLPNNNFDEKDWQKNVWLQNGRQVKISTLTEDLTWNNCLKIEVEKVLVDPNGVRKVNDIALFGATEKLYGVPVDAETFYTFKFEAKGAVYSVRIKFALFHNETAGLADTQWIDGDIKSIRPRTEWTQYEVVFRTGKNTKRVAPVLQFWHDSAQQETVTWNDGDYLLVDNVSLIQKKMFNAKTDGKRDQEKIEPVQAVFVPSQNNGGFIEFKQHADAPQISYSLMCETSAIIAEVVIPSGKAKNKIAHNGEDVWQDDVVEIFFAPVKNDRMLSQFVLASGGGRYYGDGVREIKDYHDWKASCRLLSDERRAFTFEIPFAAVGFDAAPRKGDAVPFNIGAQYNGQTYKLNRKLMSHHDTPNYPLLVFGNIGKYLKANCPPSELNALLAKNLPPDQAIGEMRAAIRRDMLNKLGNMPYLTLCLPVTYIYHLPMTFSEQHVITQPLNIKMAINEFKSLPIAIVNRTEKTASYRITVHPNMSPSTAEYTGLTGDFPAQNIIMREAVAIKDADHDGRGALFDPLPIMNQAQTINVAAGELGLVWIIFDGHGLRPSIHKGAIRVTPLMEKAAVTRDQNKGEMKDYPLTLEVLPITLKPLVSQYGWFMQHAVSEDYYKISQELMEGPQTINPWHIPFNIDNKGQVTPGDHSKIKNKIVKVLEYQKKYQYNLKIKIFIAYDCYPTFMKMAAGKINLQPFTYEWAHAWKSWLKMVDGLMREVGLTQEEWALEILDEPATSEARPGLVPYARDHAVNLEASKLAKETLPHAQIAILWAPKNFGYTPKLIREFLSYINWHVFHHLLIENPEYERLINEINATKKQMTGYYACHTNPKESLHNYYRRIGWMGANRGFSLVHLYIFGDNNWGDIGARSWKSASAGEITFRAGDHCIPSIRYMALREGFTDMRYMQALREKYQDAETGQFISNYIRDVERYSHDPTIPDKFREEVINRLKTDQGSQPDCPNVSGPESRRQRHLSAQRVINRLRRLWSGFRQH